nr:hypothetical protein [Tanacetum cinerariifolium]
GALQRTVPFGGGGVDVADWEGEVRLGGKCRA